MNATWAVLHRVPGGQAMGAARQAIAHAQQQGGAGGSYMHDASHDSTLQYISFAFLLGA